MTNQELRELAANVYKEVFKEDMPDITIKFNNKLYARKGVLRVSVGPSGYSPVELHISGKFNSIQNKYSLMRTLLHELCHLYLASHDINFADNSVEFLALADKFGVTYDTTGDYIGKVYCIKCKNCGQEYYFNTKTNINNYVRDYVCVKCEGDLEFSGEVIRDDTYVPSETVRSLTDKFIYKKY